MNNAFTSSSKRVLSALVAGATILWAVGIAAFAVPQAAHAASAGQLVKGSLSTVYFYGYDGSRYTFPNLKTYETWFTSFSGIQTISDSELASIPLGGNVVYRPGSRWIKIQSDPKTYAVARDGKIHWIETEAVATAYAGSNWNQQIDDVADVFFVDYSAGSSLMSATAFDGMLYMSGSDKYVAWGGQKLMVSDAGMTANNLRSSYFLDGTGINDGSLTSGSAVTSFNCDLSDASQTGCVAAVTGGVSVSLSSATPAGATLPQGANSVAVLSVNLTAGAQAANVASLAFEMSGVGATANVTNAYLYEGTTRLTDARSVNSTTRTVTFNNLGLALSAGQTRTVTVRVEVSSSGGVGDQIQFRLVNAAAVSASGSVAGSFPVTGNVFTKANVSVGSVTVTKNGTIVNPKLGANDHVIGQFRVTAGSVEDVNLQSVTLKIDNSADHADYKLWQGSTLLATGSSVGNRLVKFDLTSPLSILKGANRVLTVSTDVGGKNGDNVKVYVDKAVDVVALGATYGFGVSADISSSGTYNGSSCTSASGNCSFSTVEGGDVTITFNGPSSTDLPRGSQDQQIFKFNVTAQQEITVKDLSVILYADDDGDNDPFDGVEADTDASTDGLIGTDEYHLTDIKIVNVATGAVLMGSEELSGTDDASETVAFSDDFVIGAGETLQLALSVDIDNDIADGTRIGALLDISALSLEDKNGDEVTSIVPSSDIQGHSHRVTASSLTVQLASAPTSTTVVQGTNGVSFLGATFTAGDASPVTITNLTFSGYGDDTNALAMTAGGASGYQIEDYLSSCSLYSGATLVDGPKSVATTGKVVFNTLNWTVAAGASQTLTLKCNVANVSDTDNDVFAFDLLTDADITAQDDDSNEPTITLTPAGAGDEGINDTNTDNAVLDAQVAVTVTEKGTLTVSESSSTPAADFLLTGTNDNLVSVFNFVASNEAFDVKTLTVYEAQADANGLTANAYANNVGMVKIAYPKADGTTGTKSIAMTGNSAKFTALDMHVAEGSSKSVSVYVNVPATDRNSGGSATSNEHVRIAFDGTTTDGFRADGASSGSTLTEADVSDATAVAAFVVRESRPVISLSSASPSGSNFVPGDREMFRFNVAAHANEDVVLKNIMFRLSSTDNAGSSWNLCDQGGVGNGEIAEADFDLYNLSTVGTTTALDAADSEWTLLTTDGTECTDSTDVTAYAHLSLATAQIVPAGSTYTYALYFDSTGASSVQDDSVQFTLPTDPIVSTFLTASDADGNADADADTITVDSSAGYEVGDILEANTDERMLVTAKPSGTTLTVIRGYLGTRPDSIANDDAVNRMPTSLLWQDDGTTSVSNSAQEYWGSYLVKNLTVTGGAIGF